jgi:hypothetical protein
MMLTYGYDRARRRSQELGLPWHADLAVQSDALFARLGLSQAQVDVLSVHHRHLIKWLFSPRAYRWWQRLAIALHFIIGRN